ncbi:MAG: nitroreductase family protein [Candidatus Omnitrophica bacterium]|nr:nitroreductase family protein [Candidatus Omnitrophota bacterium]
MNQIIDNIKARRSKRCFVDRDIPEKVIKDIVEAGCYAPSALNKQPWKFIIFTDKGKIRRLSRIVREIYLKTSKFLPILRLIKPMLKDPQVIAALKKTVATEDDTVFYNAPALILITSDKNEHYAAKDCAIASQNMMLYATSAGISSCYIGRAEVLIRSKEARKMMGLPPGYLIQSAVVFGYSPENDDKAFIPQRKNNIINWVR